MKGKQKSIAFALSTFLVTMFSFQAIAIESDADANILFALDLYKQIKNSDGNLFFSPYSISTALAMTYAGARGNTKKQMTDVMHFSSSNKSIHSSYSDLNAQLKKVQKKGDVELNIANALWAQKGFNFIPEFTTLTSKYYEAAFEQLDFKGNAEAARRRINSWTAEQTKDRIQNVIPSGIIDAFTRLILTNAIYFKGNWASKFKKHLTTDQPFWISSDSSRQTPMMHQIEEFNYAENDIVQILELPYTGNDLSMIVLLPKERDGISQLENSLTIEKLNTWTGDLERREVDISLPKFKMDWQLDMASTLTKLGMIDAFKYGPADFSGIDGSRELYISAVLHKAYVDVNEEGTEAAAATAVVMTLGAVLVRPIIFLADHPFIFLIRENFSGCILFIGRLVNPTP
jgi:serine protease inhibitor